MTARVITGTKQEIAQKVANIEGEVREAIVFIEEPAAANESVEEMFKEMEPYMVDVPEFDDSRQIIYEGQEPRLRGKDNQCPQDVARALAMILIEEGRTCGDVCLQR